MSRLAGDMKGFVVLGDYRSTVKKQNKEKTLLWSLCSEGTQLETRVLIVDPKITYPP